jgi:hypothetical protein
MDRKTRLILALLIEQIVARLNGRPDARSA